MRLSNKMKRYVYSVVTFVVVCSVCAYLYIQSGNEGVTTNSMGHNSARIVLQDRAQAEPSKSFGKRITIGDGVLTISGVLQQARNPGSSVYVHGKKIGEIDGAALVSSSVSPSGLYVVLTTVSYLSAADLSYAYYVVDLKNKYVQRVSSPHKSSEYVGDTSDLRDAVVKPSITFSGWKGNVATFTSYFEGVLKTTGERVRVSEEEKLVFDSNSRSLVTVGE